LAILIGRETKAIVQNITGNQGTFHSQLMLDYGTKIVAGVAPGHGGRTVNGVPVVIPVIPENCQLPSREFLSPLPLRNGMSQI
jgi:succinyl-CoA synthetase alpha subunit